MQGLAREVGPKNWPRVKEGQMLQPDKLPKAPTLTRSIELEFEPNRLEPAILQQVYAQLVPIRQRVLPTKQPPLISVAHLLTDFEQPLALARVKGGSR
jgi:hypothetical protein